MLFFCAKPCRFGAMTVGDRNGGPDTATRVATRFFPVSAALRPYASIIYLTEIDAPPGARVEDVLHPEWANLRFIAGEEPLEAIGNAGIGSASCRERVCLYG